MIKRAVRVIDDFSGGQDTKTPIISMPLNRSPNMRNFHCAGIGKRLMERGGYAKLNSTVVPTDNLDEFYPPGYQTYDYPLRDVAERTEISQGFKPNTSSTVTKVRLWLKKVGAPAGNINIVIETDNSGVPSGTAITNGTSSNVDVSTLATTYGWITFTFSTDPSVTAGTQYHIVLKGDFAISATVYAHWGADNYDIIYANGTMASELQIAQSDIKALLHFDGADGSNTFTDETGKAWTAVGNAQLDTAQKEFGTASGLFDGTGDYISTPDHADWALGSGNYTIDFWIRPNSIVNDDMIFAQWDDASNRHFLKFAGVAYLSYIVDSGGVNRIQLEPLHGMSVGNWYHIAIVNYGGTVTIYKDGVSIGSSTLSGAGVPDLAALFCIGYNGTSLSYFDGWIDEFRILKGIARWTANFTPPTSAYSYATESIITQRPSYNACFEVYISSGAEGNDGFATWDFNSRQMLLGVFGTTIYKMDKVSGTPDGNWDNLLALTSSRAWTFADWQAGRVLINCDLGLYSYVGSDVPAIVSAAPRGKYMLIWKNYVFMAGVIGNLSQVRYSDLSDYTTWTAANTLPFNTDDGDIITGIAVLRGRLYIFKRYSIHRVSYLGSNPTFDVQQIANRGCPSHHAIKEVDMGGDVGTVLIFPTTDKKLAVFNGYDLEIVNDTLTEETNDLFASADDQPKTFSDMNMTYSDLFHAEVKSDTTEYILYCVLDTDTTVRYAFVFDYKLGGVFPYDNQIFASSCYAISTNKAKILYCSGYTGYTWTQESGNSDDGIGITAYVVSGKIKAEAVSLLNRALLLGIKVKEITSASTININFQYRFDWNVSWTTAQAFNYDHNDELAFGKTVLFDIGAINNMLQIKLKVTGSNPAPTIYGIELYGEPLGADVGDRATS